MRPGFAVRAAQFHGRPPVLRLDGFAGLALAVLMGSAAAFRVAVAQAAGVDRWEGLRAAGALAWVEALAVLGVRLAGAAVAVCDLFAAGAVLSGASTLGRWAIHVATSDSCQATAYSVRLTGDGKRPAWMLA